MGRGIWLRACRAGILSFFIFVAAEAANRIVITDFDANQYASVDSAVIHERIKASLQAVGPEGQVFLIQAFPALSETATNMFLNDPRFYVLSHEPKALKVYPWIRDEIAGYNSVTHQFVSMDAPKPPSWMPLLFSTLSQKATSTEKINSPWGNLIQNREGLCLISAIDLDRDESKIVESVYRKHLGCRRLLVVPYDRIVHDNDHLDLYAQFISSTTLALSQVEDECEGSDENIERIKKKTDRLATFFKNHLPEIRIVRIPFASCPRLYHTFSHEDERMEIVSYANLLAWDRSILMPRYNNGEDSELDRSLEKAKSLFQKEGFTVTSFPVPLDQARSGGSLRCLTWDGD